MSRSWVVLIMVCLLTAGTGVYYLSQSDQTISQPTLTIETGTIEKKAVAVGSIVPAHSVSIKSQNNGIVGEAQRVFQARDLARPRLAARARPYDGLEYGAVAEYVFGFERGHDADDDERDASRTHALLATRP